MWVGERSPLAMGYFDIVIIIASAVFYYRLGDIEYRCGWMVAMLSLGFGGLLVWLAGGGTWSYLGGQVLLYGVLTCANFFRSP